MSALQLAAAKEHLNIPSSNLDPEIELQAVIDSAEAAIAQRCGPLVPTEVTDRIRGERGKLALYTTPVISLVSVTPAGGSALTVDDLNVSAGGVVEYLGAGFFTSRFYDVVYSAGRTECPADLLLAVKELVRHLWEPQRGPARRPGSTTSTETSNTVPGAAYMFPFRVVQLIAPHEQSGFA